MSHLFVAVSANGVRDLPNLSATVAAARIQAGDRLYMLTTAADGSLQVDEVTAGPAAVAPPRSDIALSVGGVEIGVASVETPSQGAPPARAAQRLLS